MNIIIVGCGKVGLTMAKQLRQEDHAITVVDINKDRLEDAIGSMDIQGILGNGTSYRTLMNAGIEQADLLVAVTDQDELNMLTCLVGRKAGGCQTIARVRNPGYNEDIRYIKEELGLSMAINPEWQAAQDIFRLLQIPSALDVDTFNKGKVNMIRFEIEKDSPLDGKNMLGVSSIFGGKMLVCIRERNGEITIPNGKTELRAKDKISVVIPMDEIGTVLHKLNLRKRPVHAVTIAGGGNTSEYLAEMLGKNGVHVKIIERDQARCDDLADRLSAQIIHGDCSDRMLLQEEGLSGAEALVCLTGIDEENIMLALYAGKVSKAKLVTKISRIDFEEVIQDLPLGSVVYPKNITAETIVSYVRAMENASGNNVETLYKLLDGRVEAMEFIVRDTKITGKKLKDMPLKHGLLICSINRHGRIITPTGQDTIEMGDIVIVVTTQCGIRDLADIVR